jgi:hypothetical protein
MVGALNATPVEKIRIHPTQMKAAYMPVKGLRKVFGLDLTKLINTRNTRGIAVSQDAEPHHRRAGTG